MNNQNILKMGNKPSKNTKETKPLLRYPVFLLFDRAITGNIWKQLLTAVLFFALFFIIIGGCYVAKYNCSGVTKAFADMASPVSLRNVAYKDIEQHHPQGHPQKPTCHPQKPHNCGLMVVGRTIKEGDSATINMSLIEPIVFPQIGFSNSHIGEVAHNGDCHKCPNVQCHNEELRKPNCQIKEAETNQDNNKMPPSIILIVVYLLGSVVLSGILIATITNLYRNRADKFKRGIVQYHFKNHILVLGYDDLMVDMIRQLCKDCKNSTWIEVAVSSDVPGACLKIRNRLTEDERKRVVIVQADSCNRYDLEKRLYVKDAQSVYIIGDASDKTHDAINLDSFNLIGEICSNERMPECYVNLKFQSSFALFQAYAGSDNSNTRMIYSHFHPFNFEEEWARILIMGEKEGFNQWRIDYRSGEDNICKYPEKQIHLLIAGMTEMGEALAREAAFLCHYRSFAKNGTRTLITFIDKNAKENMDYFIGRYHRLFEMCKYTYRSSPKDNYAKPQNDDSFLDIEFEFINSNIADPDMVEVIKDWAKDKKRMLTIAVCFEIPNKNLAAALYLPDMIFSNAIPVWVYQPARGDLNRYLNNDEKAYNKFKNIVTFGASGRELLGADYEKDIQKAKKLNHFYCKGCSVGTDYESNEAKAEMDTAWRNMNISERWSNFYSISSIPVKLRGMGCVDNNIPEEMVEDLAIIEHNRWNVEKLLMGYRRTTPEEHAKWDEEKKRFKTEFIHDNICPFEELDKATQDIDRNFTREIPRIINSGK